MKIWTLESKISKNFWVIILATVIKIQQSYFYLINMLTLYMNYKTTYTMSLVICFKEELTDTEDLE